MYDKETSVGLLYGEASISERFNEVKFHEFIREDKIFPIRGVRKNYSKQDILIQGVADENDVYFIEKGIVAAMLDEKIVVDFFTENEVIGLSNLTLGSKPDYIFTAISDEVEVIRYRKEDLIEKIMNTQEGYLYHYVHMQNMTSRLLDRQELLRLPTEERIMMVLLELSERYGEVSEGKSMARFPKQINKGMLAQYTNLNPNTITTILQKLQEEEYIHLVRSSIFVDIAELEIQLRG